MRAREFLTERNFRQIEPNLKQLHDEKLFAKARAASHARRLPIIRAMYGRNSIQHDQIDLERAEIELEKERIELARLRAELERELAELNSQSEQAIKNFDQSHTDRRQQSQISISKMARSAMKHRQK